MLFKFFLNSLGSAFGTDVVQNSLKQLEKTLAGIARLGIRFLIFVFISF